MNINVTHGVRYSVRSLVVLIMLTATTGIAPVRAQGIDSKTLQSVVSSYNDVVEVLVSADFQDEQLDIGQFAEALQQICAEGNRRALEVVVEHIDTHARSRTLELRQNIYQDVQNDASFEAFLAEEDRVMNRAGFSMAARQLSNQSIQTHRNIVALSADFRLAERNTQTVIDRISQLCERRYDERLIINVILFSEETPRERKSSLFWSVSKLVGGLALIGANSLSWLAPPLAAISAAFGGIIADSGADGIDL